MEDAERIRQKASLNVIINNKYCYATDLSAILTASSLGFSNHFESVSLISIYFLIEKNQKTICIFGM
jgi:hypothetical protein